MKATPLAGGPTAGFQHALLSHGWEGALSQDTAAGAEAVAIHLTEMPPVAIEALVAVAGRLGLEVVTGEDWAVLSGARTRLSAFARPWLLPPELGETSVAIAGALPAELPATWWTRRGPLHLDRPVVVGIINVTPDSFSDGGALPSVPVAVEHARQLADGGATVFDVGGQSTRPGLDREVPPTEETARTRPVIAALREAFPSVLLSIDTVRAEVAEAAIEAGADIVNDVSGLRVDPDMGGIIASRNAGVMLMHSRGGVLEMGGARHATYADPVSEVLAELRSCLDRAIEAGIATEHIVLDPGFGFAKNSAQNLLIAGALPAFRCLGRPLLVGPSRKRFLGEVTGRDVGDRDRATAALCVVAWTAGARLFRVHDPAAVRDALAVAAAVHPAAPQ